MPSSPISNIANSMAAGAQSGQLQEQGMAYIVPIVASTAITFLLDRYVFPDVERKDHEERLKLYDEIQEQVKKSKVRRFEGHDGHKTVYNKDGKRKAKSITQTQKLIEDSIGKLEAAEHATKCGECKKTIREVRSQIEDKTEYILQAAETREHMQDLKKGGKLRKNATWDNMEDGEKKVVKKYIKAVSGD